MHDEATRWAVGVLFSVVGFIAGMLLASFRIGRLVGVVENATKRLEDALVELKALRDRMAHLNVIESTLAQVEEFQARMSSDIRDLVKRVGRLEGRSGTWSNKDD